MPQIMRQKRLGTRLLRKIVVIGAMIMKAMNVLKIIGEVILREIDFVNASEKFA